MSQHNSQKEDLREVEQGFQGRKSRQNERVERGRLPDQQHRMKDQENMRK
ncbi:MAG TPA: hypothetical protein VEY51_14770 [Chondromyces sp.]|nr:hypothetical protein [Chondromyces sp.]